MPRISLMGITQEVEGDCEYPGWEVNAGEQFSVLDVHDVREKGGDALCPALPHRVAHHPLELLTEQLAVHDGFDPLPPLHLFDVRLNVHWTHLSLFLIITLPPAVDSIGVGLVVTHPAKRRSTCGLAPLLPSPLHCSRC